ncbi:DUF4350 domain-containing protein [Alteriqipengyuania lutimaris]|uniref:DUF4350 domain-containing protein n=1 Tax=Alteriqipengyuania lutimaris TaxID=1538146 RepID=A0A395LI79_9SPHN|nr:DUF4350 domain-containing protein [Alteriqipengyuania lutimaris]MBB3034819.1 hypothetical protein [Alteriqipengyuania lutimaris]RDS76339.1 DUF4350 domain-containing protein [Alteriqipengyuania lutimaris]
MAASTDRAAFGKRGTFALVVFAVLAFVAFLFLVGQGGLSGNANNGRAHAAGTGLTGFAALTRMLEAQDVPVVRSRDRGAMDTPGLLVLTPPPEVDTDELAEIVDRRRTIGPTMIVAPKWATFPAQGRGVKPGWVNIVRPSGRWDLTIDTHDLLVDLVDVDPGEGRMRGATVADGNARWRGLGSAGGLPSPRFLTALRARDAEGVLSPVVVDDQNRMLAAHLADDGSYLDGDLYLDPERGDGRPVYNVLIVAEPDLLNNWGLADATRAALASDLVALARQGTEAPVHFDMTLNGLGASRNLLTLAFEPPFLAATLTLLLALAIAMWRAFARFGPALRPAPAIQPGKSQLVANGADVIARSRRLRLLKTPYEALARARIARRLGLHEADAEDIDRALAARGHPGLEQQLEPLRGARRSTEIVRAARSLRDLERTL